VRRGEKCAKILTMFDPISSTPQPPRKLGDHGSSLWQSIQSEYKIDDAAGIEFLTQCCEASDQIAKLAERIAEDGEVIETENGPKVHPALKEQLAHRSFIVRTLRALGLNLEPVRSVGRPTAWQKRQEQRDADE
jgi:hypothetical protein